MKKGTIIIGAVAAVAVVALLLGYLWLRRCSVVADVISDEAAWDYRDSLAAAEGNMERKQMAGAFGSQREITDEEMAMFRKATGDDSRIFYTPLSVSTQVVAGTNYKFWCRFEDTSDGIRCKSEDDSDKYGYCWVTIFKPLPGRGEPEVTSVVKE